MENLLSRIAKIADKEGITITALEANIGASKGVLSRALTNNTDIQAKWVVLIVENYPLYNAHWLLTGEGEMLNSDSSPRITLSDDGNGIPLIPIEAMAGFGTGEVQVMNYETETYRVPEFTELKVDFMIRVKGSSMYPKYSSGDLVACKKLPLNDLFFQWNKVYVLDTNQGAIIKRIKPSKKSNHIALVSENEKYDTFELHLSKINAVALVVGVIRLE